MKRCGCLQYAPKRIPEVTDAESEWASRFFNCPHCGQEWFRPVFAVNAWMRIGKKVNAEAETDARA
jgi:hypothetical protein